MERKASFENTWLDLRYPFDCAARHKGIEKMFFQKLPAKNLIRLADLGAGIGASCRYFIDKIATDQSWLLVEKDPKLSQASLDYLESCANATQWTSSMEGESLILKKSGKTVSIQAYCGDMLEWLKTEKAKEVDAITSNAIYDLFSLEQVKQLTQYISRLSIPLLTTLNYAGMSIFPTSKKSEKIVDLYENHMQRSQYIGKSIGKESGLLLQQAFIEFGLTTLAGESIWKIGSEDFEMQTRLLGFMEEAIPELPLSQEQLSSFIDWLADQRTHIGLKRSEMQVVHLDIILLTHEISILYFPQ